MWNCISFNIIEIIIRSGVIFFLICCSLMLFFFIGFIFLIGDKINDIVKLSCIYILLR